MNIYVNYPGDASSLFIFPMLPESVDVSASTRFQSYDIMNLGEIKTPQGENLTSFKWSGILPGKSRKNERFCKVWTDPTEIQSMFSVWRTTGAILHLMVTETTINHDVYLESYDCKYQGGYGDIEYSISFVVAKDLYVRVEGEPEEVKPYNGAPYVVKPGDSLWTVAEITLGDGSRYKDVFNKNWVLIVGTNAPMIVAGAQGIELHTIHPGQVLLVP